MPRKVALLVKEAAFFLILGLFLGSLLTYCFLDKNYRNFTEPKAKFSNNLAHCEIIGERVYKEMLGKAPDIKLNLSRKYFTCIQETYNMSRAEYVYNSVIS